MADEPPTKPDAPGRGVAKQPALTSDARFEHVREIARGGMGRVVEARDRQLGRTVALKESLDAHPEARLRFEREVAITARLEHPSIVPLYDAGVAEDGTPFYVMRKVSGAPLDDLIRKATSLDRRLRLLPHLLAVADAVAHAHQRGIIHRDLKPSNVLVGEHGETIVIDWGLAKPIDEADVRDATSQAHAADDRLTTAGAVVGTPGFMAPEQVSAGTLDERSDVYALGACLYYLLAGRTAFHGSTEEEVLARTAQGSIDSLGALVPGLAPDLLTIVNKAMARDPAQRYLDAGGFAEDLRRFLGGQLVASHHYPVLARLGRWVRRHRAVVAAIVLGVAVAVAIGVVSIRQILDEQRRTQAALALERDRSDELVIAQATSFLATDPTRTVATLQHLPAASPRWATLGPLLADARSRGIARTYPGGERFDIVRFAPDPNDHRMVSSGSGYVRLHDLVAHTSSIIARGDHLLRADWCGSLVVLYGGALERPRLVDPRSGATQEIAWPSPMQKAQAGNKLVAWIDRERRVITLDVDKFPVDNKPVVLAAAAPASYVDVSPSGRWLLLEGDNRTQVFHRDGEWRLVVELPTKRLSHAFDGTERRIALSYVDGTGVTVVELELATGKELRRWQVSRVTAVAYGDRDPWVLRENDLARLADKGEILSQMRTDLTSPLGLASTASGVLAVFAATRRLVVKRAGFSRVIRTPIDIYGLAIDPKGRFLVGLSAGILLAWDLADIVPQQVSVDVGETVAFAAADSLIASKLDDTRGARRVERYRLGEPFGIAEATTIGHIPTMDNLVVLDNGVPVARNPFEHIEVVFAKQLVERRDVTASVADGNDAILVGTKAGAVERYAIEQQRATAVTTLPSPVVALARTDGWIAAQSVDGSLIRRSANGHETRAKVPAYVDSIAVTSDGTVYALKQRELVAWRTAGEPRTVATFDHDAIIVRAIIGERLVVMTRDGTLHLYEPLFQLHRVLVNASQTLPRTTLSLAANGTIAATRDNQGLGAVDLASGQRWTLADELAASSVAVSLDATAIVTSELRDDKTFTLSRFAISVPSASLAWVLAATNALPPRTPAAAIEWR